MKSPSLSTYATLAFAVLSGVSAQDLSASHNVTSLLGTWSSGSGQVETGSGFVNPANFSFNYPSVTGISYSFTVDLLSDGSHGYFEEAQYRFNGNASRPNCIVGVVQWQHGTYTLQENGSMVLNPFAADGRQQVQDMCASQSNIIQQFNQTTLFANWNIYQDAQRGYKLQLYRFDGAPMSPMYLISQTPNMLPTQTLTNATVGEVASSAPRTASITSLVGVAGIAMMLGLVVVL